MGKGSDRERQAVDILQRVGYATYRPATVRYGENDVFGLFDVLAVAPHMPPRAVQVKSNTAAGIHDWKRHTALWRALGFQTEYWVPYDRDGWVVMDCGDEPDDGRRAAGIVVDERTMDCKMGDGVVEVLEDE